MNCVVVDDEALSRRVLEKCIADTPFLHLVGSYGSAMELDKALKQKSVDLIFLDIQMPNMTGIEFVQQLEDIPQVIFVTAKTGYAVEAFENDATDYLVKPINVERFQKAADKAKRIHEAFGKDKDGENTIYVKSDSRLLKLDIRDISFIEALGDYVRLHTKNGKYTVLSTMKAMETKLPKDDFMRIHKSFIVRLDKIIKIERNMVYLESTSIPVSRSYKDTLKGRLNLL